MRQVRDRIRDDVPDGGAGPAADRHHGTTPRQIPAGAVNTEYPAIGEHVTVQVSRKHPGQQKIFGRTENISKLIRR